MIIVCHVAQYTYCWQNVDLHISYNVAVDFWVMTLYHVIHGYQLSEEHTPLSVR
jgi:hypothetical protein